MKIQLVSMSVTDPIKAFKYYTETLGFIERIYMPEMYLAIVASPEDPDGTGLLLEPNANLGAKDFFGGIYQAGMPVMIFGVEDCQAEYEKLSKKGVRFIQPPTKSDYGTIDATFDDDNGNYLQISQKVS